jgi:uncharacterized coiled-coil DUF342 family protein
MAAALFDEAWRLRAQVHDLEQKLQSCVAKNHRIYNDLVEARKTIDSLNHLMNELRGEIKMLKDGPKAEIARIPMKEVTARRDLNAGPEPRVTITKTRGGFGRRAHA